MSLTYVLIEVSPVTYGRGSTVGNAPRQVELRYPHRKGGMRNGPVWSST